MNNKVKVLSLVFSVVVIVLFVYLKNDSSSDLRVRGSDGQNDSQSATRPQQKKVESHAREDGEYSDDFEPQFNDDLTEASGDEDTADPSFQDFDALEELFEEVEQDWRSSMEQLIIEDLNLSRQTLENYFELRNDYDEAKLMAFEDYHERMIEEHGEDYAFKPSLQMEESDSEILPQYIEQLETLIGEQGVRQYIQMKDEFNQKIREQGHPGMALILIDF